MNLALTSKQAAAIRQRGHNTGNYPADTPVSTGFDRTGNGSERMQSGTTARTGVIGRQPDRGERELLGTRPVHTAGPLEADVFQNTYHSML